MEAFLSSGILNDLRLILGFIEFRLSALVGLGRLRCLILGPLCEGNPFILGSDFAPPNSGTDPSSMPNRIFSCGSFLSLLTFSRLFWQRSSLARTAARFSTLNSTIGR